MKKRIRNPRGNVYRLDKRASVIKEREALDWCWKLRRPDEHRKLVDYLTLAQLGRSGNAYSNR